MISSLLLVLSFISSKGRTDCVFIGVNGFMACMANRIMAKSFFFLVFLTGVPTEVIEVVDVVVDVVVTIVVVVEEVVEVVVVVVVVDVVVVEIGALAVQVVPSAFKVNPVLHEQVKLPSVFVHS